MICRRCFRKKRNGVKRMQAGYVGRDSLQSSLWVTCRGLKRIDLAAKLGVSPQYVSKLLSGTENLSFKSIANIEEKLGITCIAIS